jgi:hypothetical protein
MTNKNSKEVYQQVAKLNKAFTEVMQAAGATEDELRAYQERLSIITRCKYMRDTPRSKAEEIDFSRILFKYEPFVRAGVELLIESCNTDTIKVSKRSLVDDDEEPTDEDIAFVRFLNWFFNEYLMLDEYSFKLLFNTQFEDYFVAGEELYQIGKTNLGEWTDKKTGKVFKYPKVIVPINPEYLDMSNRAQGFGVPLGDYRLKLPDDVLTLLRQDKTMAEMLGKNGKPGLKADASIFVKRMAKLNDLRGKSLVEAAHEPVREKYLKRARQLTQSQLNLIKDMVFIKFGETGPDGYDHEPEEMYALAEMLKNNLQAGLAMAVVPPDIKLDSVSAGYKSDGDVEDRVVSNEEILAALRMFAVLINGTGNMPAGFKDVPLTMLKAAVENARAQRAERIFPKLVNIIASLNTEAEPDTEGLHYSFSQVKLDSLENLRLRLREWEDGLLSSEDYHGSDYSAILANRKRENEEEASTFTPRQLSHTMTGDPLEGEKKDEQEPEIEEDKEGASDQVE